jgi:hypothetical protein
MSEQEAGSRPPGDAAPAGALAERLARVGREIGARESAHASGLAQADEVARKLHASVAGALDSFHEAASASGAPHLRVKLAPPRPDDKHLRSVQFELLRGRHRAIVTVKSKGEVTLVGPFRAGKPEGPCKSFPVAADAEIESALGGFLEEFREEAATP